MARAYYRINRLTRERERVTGWRLAKLHVRRVLGLVDIRRAVK